MGNSKRRAARRSAKTAQKVRFPLGELAQIKHDIKEQFLSKSKELIARRRKLSRLEEKVINLFVLAKN